MLTLAERTHGLSRRGFLTLGTLGIGGLSLSSLLAEERRPSHVTGIGQSTRDGGEPARENYTPAHLVSTVLHTVFDVGQLRLMPRLAAVSRLAETNSIPLWS